VTPEAKVKKGLLPECLEGRQGFAIGIAARGAEAHAQAAERVSSGRKGVRKMRAE